MAVTRQDVLHVAALARLDLTTEEVERFTAQLNDILVHVEELRTVDVEGVVGVGCAGVGEAPLRGEDWPADVMVRPPSELAPAWEAGFFTVPRIAALDASALDEPFEDKARVDSSIRPSPEALPEGDA